jgi:hypothetical protein
VQRQRPSRACVNAGRQPGGDQAHPREWVSPSVRAKAPTDWPG